MLKTIIKTGEQTFNQSNWTGEEITVVPRLEIRDGEDVVCFNLYDYEFEITKRIEDDFMTFTCTGSDWDYPLAVATAFYTGDLQDSEWMAYQPEVGGGGAVRYNVDPLQAIVQVLCNII